MDALRRLHGLLGAPPPDELASLDDRALADLARLVAAERVRRSRALDDAVAFSLRRVPRPARRALLRQVRK